MKRSPRLPWRCEPEPNVIEPISAGDVDERHPQRDRAVGVERPVELVLVPRRVAAARLLEERLVVVEAHAVDAEQLGGDAREAPREHERAHALVVHPEVRDLEERLAVGLALLERPRLAAVGEGGLDDRGAVRLDLGAAREPAHDGVSRSAELGDARRIERVRVGELGQRGRVHGISTTRPNGCAGLDVGVRGRRLAERERPVDRRRWSAPLARSARMPSSIARTRAAPITVSAPRKTPVRLRLPAESGPASMLQVAAARRCRR